MLSFMLLSLVFITSFLVVLSFLVFFHELGHYSVARLFGVAVERFSIGFGKPLAKWKAKSGTEWAIGRIPLGGYVKFLGDAGAASNPDTERLKEIKSELMAQGHSAQIEDCYHFKPVWQRALIALAGPMANFLLAIFMFATLALIYTEYRTPSLVGSVQAGSAAEAAGIKVGDRILTLNGKDVSEYQDLVEYVVVRSGVEMDAVIDRNGEKVTLKVTPRRQERRDALGGITAVGTMGVGIGGEREAVDHTVGSAMKYGIKRFSGTITTTGTYIGRIFQGKENGKAFGGPVRIATVTGKSAVDVVKLDVGLKRKLSILFNVLFSLAASISIGLGVANLMPIPALDGGHLLYYGYEAVAGRPLSEQKQEYGFRIGLAVIATLLIYFTVNDIAYVGSMTPES